MTTTDAKTLLCTLAERAELERAVAILGLVESRARDRAIGYNPGAAELERLELYWLGGFTFEARQAGEVLSGTCIALDVHERVGELETAASEEVSA